MKVAWLFPGSEGARVGEADFVIAHPTFGTVVIEAKGGGIRYDAERGQFDPSEASIRNSFSSVLSEYVRRELGYRNEDVYYILGGGIGRWRYPQNNGYANVVPSLERAFAKNPEMKLYVAEGYYDMATPYFAVEYTLAHMSVDPRVRAGIMTERFEAGHMVYIDKNSLALLKRNAADFVQGALARGR